MSNERSDTIAAISTALGKSGIGIVRISGPDAIQIISPIIDSRINPNNLSILKSRKLIHGYLLDQNKEKIDEVLISFMPPGKSFTGEYTIEINCHGGRAVVTSALELVIKQGARLAEPGEFTKRACLNGRIDLIQAEAINQIIESNSLDNLKIAWRQFDGGLTNKCNVLKSKIIDISSQIQYLIDFSEQSYDNEMVSLKQKVEEIKTSIEQMIACSERTKAMNRVIWISIYGPPNVGKSSLFNALLRMQRAIVCDQPGTTRDHISENIIIGGHEARLTDTAGIRETEDEIETESIRRSLEQVNSADIKMYILDSSKEITQEQRNEIKKVMESNGIVVFNKSDLEKACLIKNEYKKMVEIENMVEVSVKTGNGLDDLEKIIEKIAISYFSNTNELIMLTMRQKILLESCLQNISSAFSDETMSLDIFSYEMNSLVENIDKITGSITSEEILENVFNNFCVGK